MAKNKGGRPSKYTPELIEAICARMSKGEPLAAICRDEGMPHRSTVGDWAEARPEVSRLIARAREDGEEWIAAECLQIADSPVEGLVEKLEPHKETGELVVVERRKEDMLGHRKLQIETRLKLLAKWNPKKWGDRIAQELSGPGGGPIQAEDVTQRDADEFARRMARLAAAANAGGGTGEAAGASKG